MVRRVLIFLGNVALLGGMPFVIWAQTGLVPCGDPGEPPCTFPCFFTLIHNVFNLATEIAAVLSVLAFLIAGFFLMFSGANEGLREKGKKAISITVTGLVIVLLSWVIVNTTINVLAGFGIGATTSARPPGFPWPWNRPPGCS